MQFELRAIDMTTPAQETEGAARQEINIRLGELAARLTGRLDTRAFQEESFGDPEVDALYGIVE